MSAHVSIEVAKLSELAATLSAVIGFLSRVDADMGIKVTNLTTERQEGGGGKPSGARMRYKQRNTYPALISFTPDRNMQACPTKKPYSTWRLPV